MSFSITRMTNIYLCTQIDFFLFFFTVILNHLHSFFFVSTFVLNCPILRVIPSKQNWIEGQSKHHSSSKYVLLVQWACLLWWSFMRIATPNDSFVQLELPGIFETITNVHSLAPVPVNKEKKNVRCKPEWSNFSFFFFYLVVDGCHMAGIRTDVRGDLFGNSIHV